MPAEGAHDSRKTQHGLGFARYAAAMTLYQQGAIREDTLEVFRICAPDDGLDPVSELTRAGILHDISKVSAILT